MDLIELENGLKFMVLSSHVLNGNKYLFLASVEGELEYLFAEFVNDKDLVPVEDEEITKELLKLAADKAESILNK